MSAVVDTGLLTVIIAVLGGGGFLGGIVLLLKLRPEAGQITVSAAQGAVIVQTGVIDSLATENERLQARIDALEKTVAALAEMRNRIAALETESKLLKVENSRLGQENAGLRERIQLLETDLAGLRGPVTDPNGEIVDRRHEGSP